MSDYTPTEDEIRKVWGIAVPQDRRPERDAAFDRWLEAHDREVAARARRDAMSEVFDLLADRGCWGDYLGRDGSRQYGFGLRPYGSGPVTGVLDWLLDQIEAGEPGWLTREVKRAKDRLTEIPPKARPVVTGGYFAGLHEAGDSDA